MDIGQKTQQGDECKGMKKRGTEEEFKYEGHLGGIIQDAGHQVPGRFFGEESHGQLKDIGKKGPLKILIDLKLEFVGEKSGPIADKALQHEEKNEEEQYISNGAPTLRKKSLVNQLPGEKKAIDLYRDQEEAEPPHNQEGGDIGLPVIQDSFKQMKGLGHSLTQTPDEGGEDLKKLPKSQNNDL